MTLTIVSLLPRLQNTNGDAENAAVLATPRPMGGSRGRGRAGRASRADLPEPGRRHRARLRRRLVARGGRDAALAELHDDLRTWGTEGIPILAVGTGWELLSWGIERRRRERHRGPRHPARAARCRAPARVDRRLVVVSPRFGRARRVREPRSRLRRRRGLAARPRPRRHRQRARLRSGGRRHGQRHRHPPARAGAREEPRVRRSRCSASSRREPASSTSPAREPRWSTRMRAAARESAV